MDRDMTETLLERAAALIKASSYTVAFTGAGISHESGVPTFRGPDGLWSRYDPRVLEIDFFFRHPKESWAAIREMFFSVDHPPEPNPAHLLLARMEAQGLLHAVITMNIDNLHHRAGSRNVIEYHGNTREAVCTLCRRRYTAREVLGMDPPPTCSCGGLIKPDFVFFGEAIPAEAYTRSVDEARRAQCLLVVGTAGVVYPAASIPHIAERAGAHIIEINPEPSSYTESITEVYLPLRAAEAAILLARHLEIDLDL